MDKFEIKIFQGSNIIKEIACSISNKDIKDTVQSIKYLKKANEEYLKNLVEKERLENSALSKSCENEEEDLMGADENEEEEKSDQPEIKKSKLL